MYGGSFARQVEKKAAMHSFSKNQVESKSPWKTTNSSNHSNQHEGSLPCWIEGNSEVGKAGIWTFGGRYPKTRSRLAEGHPDQQNSVNTAPSKGSPGWKPQPATYRDLH